MTQLSTPPVAANWATEVFGKLGKNGGLRVGIDFDGTVTAHPEVMSMLVGILGPQNCYLITARHPGSIRQTEEQAVEYGFPLSKLAGASYYSEEYDYDTMGEYPGWAAFIQYKIDACKKYGVELLIEDDPRYKEPLEKAGIQVLLVGGDE